MNANVKDLSNTKGTYTKCLDTRMQDIYAEYGKATCTAESLKLFVKGVVKPAFDTEAKRNFLLQLDRQKSKDGIVMFVSNALMRGSGLGANINDKFNC